MLICQFNGNHSEQSIGIAYAIVIEEGSEKWVRDNAGFKLADRGTRYYVQQEATPGVVGEPMTEDERYGVRLRSRIE